MKIDGWIVVTTTLAQTKILNQLGGGVGVGSVFKFGAYGTNMLCLFGRITDITDISCINSLEIHVVFTPILYV